MPSIATTPTRAKPARAAKQEHRGEEPREGILVALDEPGKRRVVGALMRGDHAEGDVLLAGPLDCPEERTPRAYAQSNIPTIITGS